MNYRPKQLNVVNLRILRDFLANNADAVHEHLCMRDFVRSADTSWDRTPKNVAQRTTVGNLHECNTTLCLAGFSAIIPEFQDAVCDESDYCHLTHRLYDKQEGLFTYLFDADWPDNLDAGLARINRVIQAVEEEDARFLAYIEAYADDIVLCWSRFPDDWRGCTSSDDWTGVAFHSRKAAKAHFPVLDTPDWFITQHEDAE